MGVRAGHSLVPNHFPVETFELERVEPGVRFMVEDLELRVED